MTTELKTVSDRYDQLADELEAANKGDAKALNRLRHGLQSTDADRFVQQCGDLGGQVEENLLNAIGSERKGYKALFRERAYRLRNELGWQTAAAMERLLIEAVVIAWLDFNLAQMAACQAQTLALQEHFQKRIDRTQNRYMNSIKTLATVRKMALPVLIGIKAEVKVNHSTASESSQV